MSDPVTNVEIEDVLSSIRRLVADDARPKAAPETARPRPERLVLTPAQRVSDDLPKPAQPAGKAPVAQAAPPQAVTTRPADPARDRAATTPAAETARDGGEGVAFPFRPNREARPARDLRQPADAAADAPAPEGDSTGPPPRLGV